MKKGEVTKTWENARRLIKENKLEEAEQALDLGIVYMAQAQQNGARDKDLIEGVKREVWLERFWVSIEKYIWPTRLDYKEMWEFK
jgi:hypothetical protein